MSNLTPRQQRIGEALGEMLGETIVIAMLAWVLMLVLGGFGVAAAYWPCLGATWLIKWAINFIAGRSS